jgi:hypothetical protein
MYYVRTCANIVLLTHILLYFLRKKCKNAKAKNSKIIAITLIYSVVFWLASWLVIIATFWLTSWI